MVSFTPNKSTDVTTIAIHNVDALYDFFLFFLLAMPFQTRKGMDFLLWSIVLYMHKMGYFYLAEGRALVVSIASYINAGRYSNAIIKGIPITLDAIQQVLSITLPIVLTSTMLHLHLAQAYGKLVTSRPVYIYDNGTLVNGKPYYSYAAAQEAIGLKRTASAVKRNIDSGKVYKNRYTFYSSPQIPRL